MRGCVEAAIKTSRVRKAGLKTKCKQNNDPKNFNVWFQDIFTIFQEPFFTYLNKDKVFNVFVHIKSSSISHHQDDKDLVKECRVVSRYMRPTPQKLMKPVNLSKQCFYQSFDFQSASWRYQDVIDLR